MSSTVDRAASELNLELTGLIVEAGRKFGFDAVPEYPIPGGRLDVVWTWTPPLSIPGLQGPVPVVGFEIEPSWRTRKHLKGDLLNLQDAGVGLGVIVLAGSHARNDGLRRFAELLVDRPGPAVLVWTAEDVHALAEQRERPSVTRVISATVVNVPGASAPESFVMQSSRSTHSGKYAPLYRWLRAQGGSELTMSFGEVEEVIGLPLPNSCRQHVPHWHSYDGSAVARAIVDAGWKASRVHLLQEELTLVRKT